MRDSINLFLLAFVLVAAPLQVNAQDTGIKVVLEKYDKAFRSHSKRIARFIPAGIGVSVILDSNSISSCVVA